MRPCLHSSAIVRTAGLAWSVCCGVWLFPFASTAQAADPVTPAVPMKAATEPRPTPDTATTADVPAAPAEGSLSVLLTDFKTTGMKLLGKKPKESEQSAVVDGVHETAKGNSTTATRRTAMQELPLDNLTAEQRQRVQNLIEHQSYYRRLPTLTLAVEPTVYQYFITNPDCAASMWRAMDISRLQLKRLSDTLYEGDTGDGTSGKIEVLSRDADSCFIYCQGFYKTPFLKKPIEARSIVLLKNKFFKETDGRIYVTHRADLFVEFPSQTVEAVAKVLSPVAMNLSDRTFAEMSVFLRLISSAMATRPDWVEHITGKMEGIAETRRHDLLVLTAEVFVAHNKQALANMLNQPGVPAKNGIRTVNGTGTRRDESPMTATTPRNPGEDAPMGTVPRSVPVTSPEPPTRLTPPPVRVTRRPEAGPIQN